MQISIGGSSSLHEIVWMASVSYRNSVTNNVAEYHGLLNGLRYIQRQNIRNIHVVGASLLIINQLKHRRVPKKRKLQGLYMQCQLHADRLGVISWTHHLRQYNCMADALANQAMDAGKSIQLFKQDIAVAGLPWSGVADHLQGDADHWVGQELDRCSTSRQHKHGSPPDGGHLPAPVGQPAHLSAT